MGFLEDRLAQLTTHRQQHVWRVAQLMEELAQIHHLPAEDARLSALGHDLAREMSRDALRLEARRLGLPINAPEEEEPILLHGPVAAAWLQQENLGGPDVWEAIYYHTTAAPDLSPLAKALFIADGVEPGRKFDARARIEQVAKEQSLDDAYVLLLKETMQYLQSRRLKPHPLMLKTLESLR